MEFFLPLEIQAPETPIRYGQKIMLVGSCFTEHIGNSLEQVKLDVFSNPSGILFDPLSVSSSLISYVERKKYFEDDLFLLDELWQSWQHHSVFSRIDKRECLENINASQEKAHNYLKEADWLVITLGSSFSYQLAVSAAANRGAAPHAVANCHRAPASWFHKELLSIEAINSALDLCIHRMVRFNPGLRIIFTVSPVRHIRDGVIDNNRSKARLIETVHQLVHKFDGLYYFPAYELMIDVLRDYRFYDKDLVHPNYQGTEFVLDKFIEAFIDPESIGLMKEIKKIMIARRHKAFQPGTKAHQQFLRAHAEKTKYLLEKHPFLDLREELLYFST